MDSVYSESLKPQDRTFYFSKLRLEAGEELPDPFILTNGYSNDITFCQSFHGEI